MGGLVADRGEFLLLRRIAPGLGLRAVVKDIDRDAFGQSTGDAVHRAAPHQEPAAEPRNQRAFAGGIGGEAVRVGDWISLTT